MTPVKTLFVPALTGWGYKGHDVFGQMVDPGFNLRNLFTAPLSTRVAGFGSAL